MSFPGMKEFSAGGAVSVMPNPQQNNFLEEKGLQKSGNKIPPNSIPWDNSGQGVIPSCSARPGSEKRILLERRILPALYSPFPPGCLLQEP